MVALKVIVLVHGHDPEDLLTVLGDKTQGLEGRERYSLISFNLYGALLTIMKNESLYLT